MSESEITTGNQYPYYFKDVSHLKLIDFYRIVDLFQVYDPCVAHALKKCLLAGGRTGNKNFKEDIKEARDSLNRRLEMWEEET